MEFLLSNVLAPYTPDSSSYPELNPIENLQGELKTRIKYHNDNIRDAKDSWKTQ